MGRLGVGPPRTAPQKGADVGVFASVPLGLGRGLWDATVSSRSFSSQTFKSRVSNPRTIVYAHLKMPFESSKLPWARPVFPDLAFEN